MDSTCVYILIIFLFCGCGVYYVFWLNYLTLQPKGEGTIKEDGSLTVTYMKNMRLHATLGINKRIGFTSSKFKTYLLLKIKEALHFFWENPTLNAQVQQC